jgi:hypothetical protein
MTSPVPPGLDRFGEELDRAAHRELSTTLGSVRARLGRTRTRVFAGGTLGLVGIGSALVLALGGSTAPPAYAITTNADGSVLVTFNYAPGSNFWQLEHDLIGGHSEMIAVNVAPGPATVPGPVKCTPMKDGNPGMPPTPIKVELGQDGTGTIPANDPNAIPGVPGGSSGVTGPVHLTACQLFIETPTDTGGNTGGDTPGVFGFNPNGTSKVAGSQR